MYIIIWPLFTELKYLSICETKRMTAISTFYLTDGTDLFHFDGRDIFIIGCLKLWDAMRE